MASAATASMNVAHERHSPMRRLPSSSLGGLPLSSGSSLENRRAETSSAGFETLALASSESYSHLTSAAMNQFSSSTSLDSKSLRSSLDSIKTVPGTGLSALEGRGGSIRSLPGTQKSSYSVATSSTNRPPSPTPSPILRTFPTVESYPERSSYLSTASIAKRLATPPPASLTSPAEMSPLSMTRLRNGWSAASPSHASSGNRTLTPEKSRSNSPAGHRSRSPDIQVGITVSEEHRPRRVSPSKQVGAVLPEMTSTLMGYVHLLPTFPDPPTPVLPYRVLRKGSSGGWALLRATAQKTRFLLAGMVLREWMICVLRRKYTGPLTWIRATRARVMTDLSYVFRLQSLEALIHFFVLQWRLAVSAPSNQVVLEALETHEFPRGPRMRAQLAERRVNRSNGALEFLLMILNTHRLERMLQNSLLIWRRNVSAVVSGRREMQERYRVRVLHVTQIDVFAKHWLHQSGMWQCKQAFAAWYGSMASARETAAAAAQAAREMGYSLEARWSPQVAQLRKQHRSDVCGLLALHSTVEANHLRHACLLWWLHVIRAERQEAQFSDLFSLNARHEALIRKKDGVSKFSSRISDRYLPQHWVAHCWQAWLDVVKFARREVLLRSHAEKVALIDDQRNQLEESNQRIKDMFAGHEQARHFFRVRIGSVRTSIHQFAHRHIQQMEHNLLSDCFYRWVVTYNEAVVAAETLDAKNQIILWFGDANHGAFAVWLIRTVFLHWAAHTKAVIEAKQGLIASRKKQMETAAKHMFLLQSDCNSHLLQRMFYVWTQEVKEVREAREKRLNEEERARHRRMRRTTHEQFFNKFELAEVMIVWRAWQAATARHAAERRLENMKVELSESEAFRKKALKAYSSQWFNMETENVLRLFFEQWSMTHQRRVRRKYERYSSHNGQTAAAGVLPYVSAATNGHAKLLVRDVLGACVTGWHVAIRDDMYLITTKHNKAQSKHIVKWTAYALGCQSQSQHEFTWNLLHMALLRWRHLAFDTAVKRRWEEREQQTVSSRSILLHRHETALEDMQKRSAMELQELQQRHDATLQELQEQFAINLDDVQRRLEDSEAVGNKQLEQTVGDLQGRFASSIGELQNRLTTTDAKHREWTGTLEQRLRKSRSLALITTKFHSMEQAWFRQKVIWERWREAIAENRELGLRSGIVSQLEWHRNVRDVYSMFVSRRNEISNLLSQLGLCFRVWHFQRIVSRRDNMIMRWRKHHHDVLSVWYAFENRTVASNCLSSWRQVVDRSIQRRGISSLEKMLDKTRSRDYSLVSITMQAWCAFTGLSMRATATERKQKSVSLRQQIKRRWMCLQDDMEELVCRSVLHAWFSAAHLERETRNRTAAEAYLQTAKKKLPTTLGGILECVTLSWWTTLWHMTARRLRLQQEWVDKHQALRDQRACTVDVLQNRLTATADAWVREAFFRLLLGAVTSGRAVKLETFRHDRAAVLAGELESSRTSAFISMLLKEWRQEVISSRLGRQITLLDRRLGRTFESALELSHKHHGKFLAYAIFSGWKGSTNLALTLGKMEQHRLDTLMLQRNQLEREIADRHRALELSSEKHQVAVHSFILHKLQGVKSVALRAWKHLVNENQYRSHMAQSIELSAVWTEMHFLFSIWHCVACGERQLNAQIAKHETLIQTSNHLFDRHREMQNTAMTLAVFFRWASLAAYQAFARGAGGMRDKLRRSLQFIMYRWEGDKDERCIMTFFSAWMDYMALARSGSRRRVGNNILLAMGRKEDFIIARAYFEKWSGMRLRQVVSRTMQTSAELTYWASLQLLARHALNRWMGLILVRRQVDAETFRLGIQSKIGALSLLQQIQKHRASDTARAVLGAWLHIAVESGRMRQAPDEMQLLAIRRRARYYPAKMMTARMADVIKSALLVTTWHVWVVAVCDSNVEAHTEFSAIKHESTVEREEYLIALTLLIWGQEQSLTYARAVLVAWCHAAARGGRAAQLKSLGERMRRQVGTREKEHSRVVDGLLRRSLTSGDREFALSCLHAWYRVLSEAALQRVREERMEETVRQRFSGLKHSIATSIAHQALVELDFMTLLQAVLLRWHLCAMQTTNVIREQYVKAHQRHHTTGVIDSLRSMHIGLMAVTALRAWNSVTVESKGAAALAKVQKEFRRETRQRVTLAAARSFHLEDGVVRLFCFMGWCFQTKSASVEAKAKDAELQSQQAVAQARLMADTRLAEARAVEAVSQMRRSSTALAAGLQVADDEDLEMAIYGVPLVRTFQAWRLECLGEKRERLQTDLHVILALLQQASCTIEDMRLRLLLARLYGSTRREVLLSWRQVVDAEHTLRLARAPSVLGSERSASGLSALAAIQAAAQESSRSLVPLTAGSQVTTYSQASSIKSGRSLEGMAQQELMEGPEFEAPPALQRESLEVTLPPERLGSKASSVAGSVAGTSQVISPITQVSPSAYPSSATATPATHSRLIGAGRTDFYSTSQSATSLGPRPSAAGGSIAASAGMSAGASSGQRTPPLLTGGIRKTSLSPPRDRNELIRQLQQVRNSVLETQTQASLSGNVATKLLRSNIASLKEDLSGTSRPASAKSTNSGQNRF